VKIMSEADGTTEPAAPVVRALVAGHGDFAMGLVSAVDVITGQGKALDVLEVKTLCGDDIQLLLRTRLAHTGARVIFTDLQAGSCTMAARRLLRDTPGVVLVSGTNLPMLLDFVLSRTTDPVEAARAAVERGKSAMSVYGGQG
jgi:PTS system N-acetylgalactosamine-specific IIA component